MDLHRFSSIYVRPTLEKIVLENENSPEACTWATKSDIIMKIKAFPYMVIASLIHIDRPKQPAIGRIIEQSELP